jgi:L-amino acid N-acyltransferase YncA
MKFLFDSNVIIPAEPTSPQNVEALTPLIADLVGLLSQGQHHFYSHPVANQRDLGSDKDTERRSLRKLLIQKYPELPSPPKIPPALAASIGTAPAGSHDEVDNLLLAAVYADAVDYLVTQDEEIHKKARAADLQSRVLSVPDTLAVVRALFPRAPAPPPAVESVPAYLLDEQDPIFESFRADYGPGFDNWLRRAKREHRTAWIIRRPGESLAGFTIVKPETDRPYGLHGQALKICSFKVANQARGFRFGELLLKTVFGYAFANRYDHLYVTVFDKKYGELVDLFTDFGFGPHATRSPLGELVLTKPLKFEPSEYASTPPLAFNVRYGPANFKIHGVEMFVIPIRPVYHRLLFPDAQSQLDIMLTHHPFANSIRKAYLCHASTRRISPGSVLLFYRSDDEQAVRSIGVAEGVRVSKQPDEITHFVGQRTVYSYNEIAKMSEKPVLAILFRHARNLAVPISLADLRAYKVLSGPPQSIVRVREEGMEWVRERLSGSS